MKKFIPKPKDVSIFAQVFEGQTLMDLRRGRSGLLLGTIPSIATQYGVKAQKQNGGFVFSGPANRVQILVEKLHFAGIPYFEL